MNTTPLHKTKLTKVINKHCTKIDIASVIYTWQLLDEQDNWLDIVELIERTMAGDTIDTYKDWKYFTGAELSEWYGSGDDFNQLSEEQLNWLISYKKSVSEAIPHVHLPSRSTLDSFYIEQATEKASYPFHDVLNNRRLCETFIDLTLLAKRLEDRGDNLYPEKLFILATGITQQEHISNQASYPTETIRFITQIHDFMFKDKDVFNRNFEYHDKDDKRKNEIPIEKDKNIQKIITTFGLTPLSSNGHIYYGHPDLPELKLSKSKIRILIDAAKPDKGIPNR